MALTVLVTTTLIWLMAALRFVPLLPLGRGARVVLAIALLPVAQYWFLANWVFGSFAHMEMPRWQIIALGCAFGTLMLLALFLFLRDVLGGLLYLLHRGGGRALLRGRGLNLALGVLAVVLGVWGTAQGVRLPEVKRVEIRVPTLPAAFDGYRVVLLTDLHASPMTRTPWMRATVERVNALQPDLIAIAGDFQDGTVEARAPDVEPMRDLRARDGVIGAPGNHEYYTSYTAWMQALRGLGIHMLENEHTVIERHGAQLAVVGLTDRQAAAFRLPTPDLAAARQDLPQDVPMIVLSHQPRDAARMAQSGAALMLAGHTHGGQIRGADLLTKMANSGFLSGLYNVDGMPLYVSNGTGVWHGLPLRVGRPSEITEITLRPGD